MMHLDIIPQPDRRVVELRLVDQLDGRAAFIELTAELVAATISNLIAAWSAVEKDGNHPAEPGSWFFSSAIESPAWKVGVRPMDGAITLTISPVQGTARELWLTYALPPSAATKMIGLLEQALSHPAFGGSA